MKMRLDLGTRTRVITLKQNGLSYLEIKRHLEEEDIKVSIVSLWKLVDKYHRTSSVIDRPRLRPPRKLSDDHYALIDQLLTENDELTTRLLLHKLKEQDPDLNVSLSTVKRARRDLGWVSTTPRYCQMVREANKEKRLKWCEDQIANSEKFDDVIFTDECSVQLDVHRRKCYRKKSQPRKLKMRPKHPPKIHVWGGISKQGATPIVLFSGTLNATRLAKIFDAGLVPFVQQVFPAVHRFQQDNDPKHSSKYIKQYIKEKGINWWKTPAESPDLNPIECVWGSMKEYLRNSYKPRNLEDLKIGIKTFWKTLTPEICSRYINHLHTVMPVVVRKQGNPSGY